MVSLAITAFLLVPTFLVPSVPLWLALVSLAPLVLLGTHSIDSLYGRLSRFTGAAEDGVSTPNSEFETIGRHRYATGEIDEATFERKLDRLLKTGTLQRRNDGPGRDLDLRRG